MDNTVSKCTKIKLSVTELLTGWICKRNEKLMSKLFKIYF